MNAADVLTYGQLTFLDGLSGLPDGDWETPGVCGYWSVKQFVAHIASYEAAFADVLVSVSDKGPTPTLDRFVADNAGFNGDEVARRADLSPAATLAELKSEYERVKSLIERVPAATLRSPGTIPWYGSDYAIDDLIVYQVYGHKREHVAQICAFRDHRAG